MSNTSGLRQWLKNVTAGYGETLVGAVVFIGMTPIVLQRLGVEAYAVWVLSHTISFYLRFFDLGFGEAQVRVHARFAARRQQAAIAKLIATVLLCLVLAGFAAALLGIALAIGAPISWLEVDAALETELRTVLAILALNLLVSIPSSGLQQFYDGAQRFDLASLRAVILRVVSASAQLTALLLGHGVVTLALIELAVTVLGVLIDLIILRRLSPGLLTTPALFDRRMWRRVRHFALWTSLDDLIAEGTSHLDELLLVFFLPLALLTPYALLLAFTGALLPLVRPITETFFPMVAALHAQRALLELKRLLITATKGLAAIGVLFAVCVGFFGFTLFEFWVPEAATEISPTLIAILVSNVLLTASLWTSGIMLLALNRIRWVVALNLLEVFIEVALITWLAPQHGLLGIAIASLIANVLVGLGLEIPLLCRTLNINAGEFFSATFGRLTFAAGPLVFSAFILSRVLPTNGVLHSILAVAALCSLWLLLLYFIGTSRDERQTLGRYAKSLLG
jgi:O-antigen/teichoic acid export membrane protein